MEVTYISHMGDDNSVVDAARVSFGKHSGRYTKEQNDKLIKFLAKHKHLSPFGHAFASFHVKAPIFVARQLVKHQYLRWNEISRRYVDEEPEFYLPDVWRGRSEDKKQGSSGVWQPDYITLNGAMGAVKDLYDQMIYDGCAPEQARMVLPQSTMTEWYWSGSLDAFANMCKLRCASDSQYESRIVANQISGTMGKLFPVSWEALVGPTCMFETQESSDGMSNPGNKDYEV